MVCSNANILLFLKSSDAITSLHLGLAKGARVTRLVTSVILFVKNRSGACVRKQRAQKTIC